MMANIKVTGADLNDPVQAGEVLRLLRSYAADIMGGGEDLSDDVKQNLIERLQKKQDAVILLAYDGEAAVGLAIAFEGFSTFYAKPLLNIHDFAVLEKHRGKGIAKMMLEKLEEIARERGCCKLTLEVLEGNERAQKVYKTFGFASYELDPVMGKAMFLNKKLNNI
jgi:ribosomal protein S18 acetylase RimI-like enzyme